MKLDKITIEATIPCSQYGNIRPTVEMSDTTIEEATKTGMSLILPLFEKYSEKGALVAKEMVVATTGVKKSFNEGVEIGFEPVRHSYSYEGKPIIGATEYIKKFFKPFDADTISSVLESKWGVPQQTIKDLWESNGDLTSSFGNVIHKALEHYENFKDSGEIISSQQKEEGNYCLPKHPILKKIVEEFIVLVKDEKGEIVTEVLLSDVKNGVCGTADRLVIVDRKKKICRVADYKVNINSEEKDKNNKVLAPFDDLPSTKLSKYQLQMSVYANMLQHSGWTVEALDVYVYEDIWRHFELPVLKVL